MARLRLRAAVCGTCPLRRARMAYGQIDPARLEGDALRRWYLRSPSDIEEERRLAAERKYERFFGVLPPAAVSPAAISTKPTPRAYESGNAPPDAVPSARRQGGQPQIAMAATRGVASSDPADCVTCHGHVRPLGPLPLPPPIGTFPLPPRDLPFFRDMPGGAHPPPRREDRKQCELQERRDLSICSQQPTEPAKAECYSNVPKRRYHCNETGEIGIPGLFTARRKSGRRWP